MYASQQILGSLGWDGDLWDTTKMCKQTKTTLRRLWQICPHRFIIYWIYCLIEIENRIEYGGKRENHGPKCFVMTISFFNASLFLLPTVPLLMLRGPSRLNIHTKRSSNLQGSFQRQRMCVVTDSSVKNWPAGQVCPSANRHLDSGSRKLKVSGSHRREMNPTEIFGEI